MVVEAEEVGQGEGDHDGGVAAAGGGQVLGAQPLEELAERLAAAQVHRPGVPHPSCRLHRFHRLDCRVGWLCRFGCLCRFG